MEELIVPKRSAVTGGNLSLESLVARPDGLLARADNEPIELAPIGTPELFEVTMTTAERDYSQTAAGIAEELKTRQGILARKARMSGATGNVFYKASGWVYDGLIAVQFYRLATNPAMFPTKQAGLVAARPIGPPAVLWNVKDARITTEHLVDAWDDIFAAIKQRPNIAQAGYVLGERQTNDKASADMVADEPVNPFAQHRPTNFLDEMQGGTNTATAIQFYIITPGNLGAERNTGLPTQRVAALNRA